MSRLDILNQSLAKKQARRDVLIDSHIKDVLSANGQPLNDKRDGHKTLNRWDKQNDSIRNQIVEIERTERAIQIEQSKIESVNAVKDKLPEPILHLIESGELVQWRKYPNRFFVAGVDKARIIFNFDSQTVSHCYVSCIKDKAQFEKFKTIYNGLNAQINKAGE